MQYDDLDAPSEHISLITHIVLLCFFFKHWFSQKLITIIAKL